LRELDFFFFLVKIPKQLHREREQLTTTFSHTSPRPFDFCIEFSNITKCGFRANIISRSHVVVVTIAFKTLNLETAVQIRVGPPFLADVIIVVLYRQMTVFRSPLANPGSYWVFEFQIMGQGLNSVTLTTVSESPELKKTDLSAAKTIPNCVQYPKHQIQLQETNHSSVNINIARSTVPVPDI
jgi:hypothetical protein